MWHLISRLKFSVGKYTYYLSIPFLSLSNVIEKVGVIVEPYFIDLMMNLVNLDNC